MVVHRPCAGVALVPPDFIKKLSLEITRWAFFRQELQYLELLWSNYDLFACTSDFGSGKIRYHIRKDVYAFRINTGITSD